MVVDYYGFQNPTTNGMCQRIGHSDWMSLISFCLLEGFWNHKLAQTLDSILEINTQCQKHVYTRMRL